MPDFPAQSSQFGWMNDPGNRRNGERSSDGRNHAYWLRELNAPDCSDCRCECGENYAQNV